MTSPSPPRLRHLFITGGYPPQAGIFAHRALLALRPVLESRVVRLRTLHPLRLRSRHYEVDGIPVREVPSLHITSEAFFRLFCRTAAISTMPRIRDLLAWAEIIEVNGLYPLGHVPVFWKKTLGLETPLVGDAVGSDVMLFLKKAHRKDPAFVEGFLRHYDACLCNSAVMSDMLRSFSASPPIIKTAYRGVDLETFRPDRNPSGPLASAEGIRFLYLGGFLHWKPGKEKILVTKGGHVLLEAWQQAEPKLAGASLALGGPGTSSRLLESWRSGLLHPERVHVLGEGTLPSEDIPGYICAADCVVLPSLSEGLPNVANETQACARAAIVTDVGDSGYSVLHGETGFVIRPGSVEELRDCLIRCASDGQALREMGRRGRLRMERHFNWSRYVATACEAYGDIFRARGLPTPPILRSAGEAP